MKYFIAFWVLAYAAVVYFDLPPGQYNPWKWGTRQDCGLIARRAEATTEIVGKPKHQNYRPVFYVVVDWDSGLISVKAVDVTTYELGVGKRFCWETRVRPGVLTFFFAFLFPACLLMGLVITLFISWATSDGANKK